MDQNSAITLAVFIGICMLTALSGAFFRPGKWYQTIRKPSWNPPDKVFGPVWGILYIMIAVAGWLVWMTAPFSETMILPMTIFGVQLVMNFLWSGLFFGAKRIDLALLEVSFLWISVIELILAFLPIHPLAGYLLIPYALWVSFAAFLNLVIYRLNRKPTPVAEPAV
ncbi:TspO/MBR family protein [Rhodospirillum rubrum]|nr:TspO/MBR family protein [Rhodospirillum rubrum]AEO48801.1 TspO and MBR-related protein [Rhodospirillum rubrum F11]QXG79055.1 tryptophan-rich sensory protein [Rhodospirillum rubrum]